MKVKVVKTLERCGVVLECEVNRKGVTVIGARVLALDPDCFFIQELDSTAGLTAAALDAACAEAYSIAYSKPSKKEKRHGKN